MNSKYISFTAIGLWAVTIAAIAFLFFKGNAKTAEDGRSEVMLTHSEKVMVLAEMRQMLAAAHGVLEGLNANDMAKVESAALSGGTAMMIDLNPAFMMKLPAGFKQQGVNVHKYFDSIAEAAKNGKSKDEILKMITVQMGCCVQCHAAFQISVE